MLEEAVAIREMVERQKSDSRTGSLSQDYLRDAISLQLLTHSSPILPPNP
jgi:hypothetical protein